MKSESSVPHAVVYGMPGCGPCKRMAKALEQKGHTVEVRDVTDATVLAEYLSEHNWGLDFPVVEIGGERAALE